MHKQQDRLKRLNQVVEKQNEIFLQKEEDMKKAQETFELGMRARDEMLAKRDNFYGNLLDLGS